MATVTALSVMPGSRPASGLSGLARRLETVSTFMAEAMRAAPREVLGVRSNGRPRVSAACCQKDPDYERIS